MTKFQSLYCKIKCYHVDPHAPYLTRCALLTFCQVLLASVDSTRESLPHFLLIIPFKFTSELRYVPPKGKTASIEARAKNTSEYELLVEPVSVFVDESL